MNTLRCKDVFHVAICNRVNVLLDKTHNANCPRHVKSSAELFDGGEKCSMSALTRCHLFWPTLRTIGTKLERDNFFAKSNECDVFLLVIFIAVQNKKINNCRKTKVLISNTKVKTTVLQVDRN